MKLKILINTVLIFASIVVISCSDLSDDIVVNEAPAVHPEGWAVEVSPNFHAKSFKNTDWDLKLCTSCHASNYNGGITGVSCRSCHLSEAGPEACNTCHGDFNGGLITDSTRLAPPRTVLGNDVAAGAHVSHLYENDLTNNVQCAQCHVVPSTMTDDGHIVAGARHATLTFGNLAKNQGSNPDYNFDSNSCSNVYCHGNFVFLKDSSSFSFIYLADSIKGNKFNPIWNKLDDTQAECGTCHSLPPIGHLNEGNDPTAVSCGNCHTGIVDSQGKIVDKDKHINGIINVFGN